jgi:hypothetical protein
MYAYIHLDDKLGGGGGCHERRGKMIGLITNKKYELIQFEFLNL